jgi:hypothetical protein
MSSSGDKNGTSGRADHLSMDELVRILGKIEEGSEPRGAEQEKYRREEAEQEKDFIEYTAREKDLQARST